MSCSKAHVCLNNDLHVTHRRLVPNHIEMADLLRPYARDNASAVRPSPKVIKIFMLNSTEHEIYPANYWHFNIY